MKNEVRSIVDPPPERGLSVDKPAPPESLDGFRHLSTHPKR
jgi:hypothetical protein